jgi:hypothetical protein
VGEILGGAVEGDRAAFDQAKAQAAGEQQGLPLDLGDDALPDLRDSEDHMALPDASEVLAIQMELGGTTSVAQAVAEYRRRAGAGGRKKGSRNRRTDDFSRWLLSHGTHPGLFMMRILSRPVDMLAAELRCDPKEAVDRQIRCAAELLPYFEGKKPVEVNVSGKGGMALVLPGMMPGMVDGGMIEAEQLPISLEPPADDDKQDDKHDAQGGEA